MNIKFVILFCLFTIGLNAQQPAETAPGLIDPDDQNFQNSMCTTSFTMISVSATGFVLPCPTAFSFI